MGERGAAEQLIFFLPSVLKLAHEPQDSLFFPSQVLRLSLWDSVPCRPPCSGSWAKLSSTWQHGRLVPSYS